MALACAGPSRRASRSPIPSPTLGHGRALATFPVPVGSARSATRELRDRCRLGLIDSEIENADELHFLRLTDSGCVEVGMSPAEVNEGLQPAAAKPRA